MNWKTQHGMRHPLMAVVASSPVLRIVRSSRLVGSQPLDRYYHLGSPPLSGQTTVLEY